MTPWKELYVALSMIVLAPVVNTQSRPNIVIIMADDMGWGDVGVNWPETVDTPTLDQLAHEGLRLTDFHAGASVCTPSRAALLTGRLGLRTGVTKNFGDWALGGIPTNETTIAEILQDAGYKTAMLGKWHLGTRPGHHPLDKGFQRYLGVPYSIDMGCANPPGANLPPCPGCPEENSVYRFVPTPRYCFENALPLYENQSIAHQPVSLVNLSTMYADFARNFIQEQNTSEPYFLYAALSHMHVPLAHADRYENITGRGVYADTLREMDGLVESIISVVRETDNNTLIWFTSDNGPWEVKCQYAGSVGPFIGMWQESPEGGGGGSSAKTTIWEAGHRVPSILYWPGHIEMSVVPLLFRDCIDDFRRPLGRDRSFFGEDRDFFSGDRSLRSEFRRPLSIFDQNFGMGMMQDDLLSPSIVSPLRMGYYRPWRTLAPRQSGVSNIQYDKDGFKAGRVSSALTSALDILPTLTMLGKGSLPTDRKYDGKDMTPIINGTSQTIREVLFHPNSGAGEDGVIGALRIGPYKLVYQTGGIPDCSGEAGPLQNYTSSPLLFSLKSDLSEGSPIDQNSTEYEVTKELGRLILLDLEESIRADNTSSVDYSQGEEGKVCCNSQSPICRCPWD